MKGAWLVFFAMSFPAFFLNLEQITKVISVGNLMNYSFVSACGIALRFRQRDTQTTVRSDNEKFVWLFLASSLIFAVVFINLPGTTFAYISGIVTAVFALQLCMLEQPNKPRTGHYNMPLVPFLPLVGIQINFLLACSVDLVTWYMWLCYCAFGLIIYFGYSMRHSNLEPGNILRGQIEESLITSINHQKETTEINPDLYVPPEMDNDERRQTDSSEYKLKQID